MGVDIFGSGVVKIWDLIGLDCVGEEFSKCCVIPMNGVVVFDGQQVGPSQPVRELHQHAFGVCSS
jgi:hypothetical protein